METGLLYVVFNKTIRDTETNELLYKIGITKNQIDERYHSLGLKMPGKFETLFAYRLEDYAKAEQTIHQILHKYRENGEWFKLSQKELEHIKMTCELMGGYTYN
jgi:predicted Zn-dependent peptidase